MLPTRRPYASYPKYRQAGEVQKASPEAPTIVLAILDTVRAGNTSLCGYNRNTTPFLSRLVREGAAYSCRAYAPSDWSFSSHASYFTGVSATEHGAAYVLNTDATSNQVDLGWGAITPLSAEFKTLASLMRERGYQTLMVTDNRLLTVGELNRGIDTSLARELNHDPRHSFAPMALKYALAEILDRTRPLFLILNFLEAHDPWAFREDDTPWQDATKQPFNIPSFQAAMNAFRGKDLDPRFREPLQHQLRDLYDYGVRREDRSLQKCMELLESGNWFRAGGRIAITADHGEMLMEHDMWRHHYLYEENLRVPLVLHEVGKETRSLPNEALSAMIVHDWLASGKVSDEPPPPHAMIIPNGHVRFLEAEQNKPALVLWHGDDKLIWLAGEEFLFDLKTDPEEQVRRPIPPDHEGLSKLRELVKQFHGTYAGRADTSLDVSVNEQLRALGYMDP